MFAEYFLCEDNTTGPGIHYYFNKQNLDGESGF